MIDFVAKAFSIGLMRCFAHISCLSLLLVAWLPGTWLQAAQEGIVQGERVNLRTRPTLVDSEAFAKVHTGEVLQVLETVANEDNLEGSPSAWYRVSIPKNIPLWVSANLVDAPTGKVAVNRLNIRVGPGLNHQAVGQFMQNDVVTPMTEADGWLGIQAPAQAFAYIASDFVTLSPAVEDQTDPETVEGNQVKDPEENLEPPLLIIDDPNKETPTIIQATVSGNQPDVIEPEVVQAAEAEIAQETRAADRVEPPVAPSPERNGALSRPPVDVEPTEVTTAVPAIPEQETEDLSERLRRIVTREGIVKRSRSIQAPTYHRLEDPATHRTMNYLYTGGLHLNREPMASDLKPYEQYRIRVTGQESVDPQWPGIPVIEIESLRLID
jgi:uncharacterized protein YgiM (DUF1202 family)